MIDITHQQDVMHVVNVVNETTPDISLKITIFQKEVTTVTVTYERLKRTSIALI